MSKTYRGYTREQIAKTIDHSVLKPDFKTSDVEAGAKVAREYDVASYCIRPMDVPLAAKLLAGSNVPVCTVIGFPHGTTTSATKAFETAEAVRNEIYKTALTANMGNADAARKTTEEAMRYLSQTDAGGSAAPGATTRASFATAAEAEAAAKAGKIQPGDRISIGGQSGTWR